MRYTREAIRADLEGLGVRSWDWAGARPGTIRSDVRARNPGLGAATSSDQAAPLDELVEYCWTAYQKSFTAAGDMVIGREAHLGAAGLYGKVAELVNERTLFDPGTHGNVLKMDKWARVMNDSWILGGVHRRALFRLASPRVMDNLWNKDGYFVVTAREILGLLNFGYGFEQVGPWQCLVCRDQVRATTADLIEYHHCIGTHQTIQQASDLLDPEGSAARVRGQVQDFRGS